MGLKFNSKETPMDEKSIIVLDAIKAAGKPLRAGDVAKLTGLDKDEVASIFKVLKKEGKLVSPKACFYAPPE
jgi:DNA-binding IclR family transcriptional regulator